MGDSNAKRKHAVPADETKKAERTTLENKLQSSGDQKNGRTIAALFPMYIHYSISSLSLVPQSLWYHWLQKVVFVEGERKFHRKQ